MKDYHLPSQFSDQGKKNRYIGHAPPFQCICKKVNSNWHQLHASKTVIRRALFTGLLSANFSHVNVHFFVFESFDCC